MSGFLGVAAGTIAGAVGGGGSFGAGGNSTIPLRPSDPAYPPAYTVVISGHDELGNPIGTNGSIVASLPENFDISVSAQYSPIFPGLGLASIVGLSSGVGGIIGGVTGAVTKLIGAAEPAIAAGTQALTGYSDQVPALSQVYWTHTDPISFTLPLKFNAVYDAKAEVMANIQSLILLTLPSVVESTGLLRGPGPSILGNVSSVKNLYDVKMTIGTAWTFSNVIITSVHGTIDTMADGYGNYISATVNINVILDRTYTKQDMIKAFQGQGQTQPIDPISALTNTAKSLFGGGNGSNPGGGNSPVAAPTPPAGSSDDGGF